MSVPASTSATTCSTHLDLLVWYGSSEMTMDGRPLPATRRGAAAFRPPRRVGECDAPSSTILTRPRTGIGPRPVSYACAIPTEARIWPGDAHQSDFVHSNAVCQGDPSAHPLPL